MSSIAAGIPQALAATDSPTFAGATVSGLGLTTATMTKNASGVLWTGWSSFSWTNAMVVALGASVTGDIKVATLPAKTMVHKSFLVINSLLSGLTSCTVAVGRTSALYIDYIVASDAKVAANTRYGVAVAQLGTGLVAGLMDVPSWTAATDVYAHFISGIENLSACLTCTGTVYLQTTQLT